MTSTAILLLALSYAAVTALLLALNLGSRWRWPIKAGVIVLVSGLYVGGYYGYRDLAGWPSDAPLPDYFRLHWAVISEPDKFTGDAGEILVWAGALDDSDREVAPPRAFRLLYDAEMALRLERALGLISQGEQVIGNAVSAKTTDDEALGGEAAQALAGTGTQSTEAGFAIFPGEPPHFDFQVMPPPEQPAKKAL